MCRMWDTLTEAHPWESQAVMATKHPRTSFALLCGIHVPHWHTSTRTARATLENKTVNAKVTAIDVVCSSLCTVIAGQPLSLAWGAHLLIFIHESRVPTQDKLRQQNMCRQWELWVGCIEHLRYVHGAVLPPPATTKNTGTDTALEHMAVWGMLVSLLGYYGFVIQLLYSEWWKPEIIENLYNTF